jgi:hypothetical protein
MREVCVSLGCSLDDRRGGLLIKTGASFRFFKSGKELRLRFDLIQRSFSELAIFMWFFKSGKELRLRFALMPRSF